MSLSYKNITPLLLTSHTEAYQLHVQFQAPNSQKIVKAQTFLQRTHKKSQLIENVKRSLMSEVQLLAYQTVREILGMALPGKIEQDLLTCMMMQLVVADKDVSEEERAFLEENTGLSWLQIEELRLMENPVLAVEYEDSPQPEAETIYLLTYTIALADNHLQQEEQQLLKNYAEMLRLPLDSVQKLTDIARAHLFEKALRFSASWEDLLELGTRLGMNQKDVDRA